MEISISAKCKFRQSHHKGAYLMNHLKTSGSISKLASFTGMIGYPLMNDYMFRSVMQSNENVLKGLLCSLLHLNPNDIWSVQFLNPFELV